MEQKYVMGIDVGTNETKGVILDRACQVVCSYTVSHEVENPSPNHFEQDADGVWWHDVCKVSQGLLRESGVEKEKIRMLGVSALGCDCVPVDRDCKPLCKGILYGIDSRSHGEIAWLNEYYGDRAEEIYGHPICSSDIAPKILWIKNHLPQVYEKTYKFLTASSFITAKLTGRYCIDKYLAEDFLPLYDLEKNAANDEMCGLYCRPDQLAEILYATDIAGEVTEAAAKATGLLPGTKVLTGTGDSGAEAISAGVFVPGDLMVQLGSSCYFVYLADRLVQENRLWPGTFIIPDTFSICAGTNTAGTLTKWFKQNFYFDKEAEENNGGPNAFSSMAEAIRAIPAGCEGLITLPYFAGERTPLNDPFAKGMVIGLQLCHTREHIYKSALEGIACSIWQHLKILEENKLPVGKIMAVGGGTKNEPWLQLIADVLNRPVHLSQVTMGAAYGDGLMAALAAGFYESWEELSQVVKPAKTYLPKAENREVYDRMTEMFGKLYEANKEFMHELCH